MSEALRLANVLDNDVIPENSNREAAAELRRLHDEVRMLQEQNTELDKKLAELERRDA